MDTNLIAGTAGGIFLFTDKGTSWTTVSSGPADVPRHCYLSQNYPNPFNPTTTIQYALPHRSHMTLIVYNTLGQQVATLVNGEVERGNYKVQFDGSGLASGLYFYRLQAGEFVQTRKLLLIR